MKRTLLVVCFAMLATRAYAMNPYAQDWLVVHTEEERCADARLAPDAQIDQCIGALHGEIRTALRSVLVADLGIAYARAGRFNLAMDYLTQVLIADPGDWRVLQARGSIYLHLKRYNEALADAESVLRLKPDAAYARILRGRAHALQGDLDAALSDANAAIALRPDGAEGYFVRAIVYDDMEKYSLAIADWDKTIALHPAPELYNDRCFDRARLNSDLAAAFTDCAKALEPGPVAKYLDSRGFVYFRLGDYKAAIADYDAALGKKPNYASSLFMRGIVKRKSGDAAGGDADIVAAKAIDAKVAATYAKFGVTP
jgi:tetratricopeptide (TPR) repeat protein